MVYSSEPEVFFSQGLAQITTEFAAKKLTSTDIYVSEVPKP